MRLALLIVVSVAVAGFRVAGVTSPAYQAAAHLWLGFLAGGCLLPGVDRDRRPYLWLLLALSAVELAAFLIHRRG